MDITDPYKSNHRTSEDDWLGCPMTSAKYIRFHETILSFGEPGSLHKKCVCFSIFHSIHVWNSYLHLDTFGCFFHVGKYTSPMDGKGLLRYSFSWRGKSPATRWQVITPHPRFLAFVANIRHRKGAKVSGGPWIHEVFLGGWRPVPLCNQ